MRKIYSSVIACSIALGLSIGTMCPKADAAEKLRFVADWILGGKHAPFLLARDMGYWKKAGLDILINRGFGSGTSSKILAAKKADFSFIDLGTLILHRTKGAMIRQVAAIHAINPIGYVAFSKSVKEPKDLAGKTFGGSPWASTTYLLPAFLKRAKVDPKSVKIEHMKISSILPSFMAGKIDLFGVYTINSLPFLRLGMIKQGRDPDKELSLFLSVDQGMDSYSNGLTVRDDMIQNNPGLVRRWVRSTLDAFRDTVKNPERTLKNFNAKLPEVSKEASAAELDGMIRSLLSPEARTIALGWLKEEKVRLTQDAIFETGKAKGNKLPLKDLYSTEFLEKRPVTKDEIPGRFQRLGLL